ncbi:hypothetical protein [Metallibacterium scheffleri]|uniref:Uncharacterized protein n=1 Tax=Metallibacterium scheffleri TaxID=993689 RepID=A0A4S3KTS0_9GAMM|nr:hypothetical protein [Metallibacterium scheffleri]THD11674.1 hypothetical protein B1806_02615 [Metallibacterium scheffleri]
MSTHFEWIDEVVAEHDTQKPFAPENGLPLRFKAGDRVIYTNEYGLTFDTTVKSIYARDGAKDALYATGRRYWTSGFNPLPVCESDLQFP